MAAFVAILLPLSLVALAGNIVFRVPDLMAFEISRSSVLAELGLDIRPDAVADEIADFINHNKEELTLTTRIARNEAPVFSFMDEVNLGRIRVLLDRSLYPAIGAMALSIALFAFVRAMGRRRYLRYAMRASAVFYICAIGATLTLALYQPLREAVFAWQPGLEFIDGDILPQLLGGLYPIISAGAVCLISFIIYITLYSVSRRFTAEKERMF